LTARRERFRTVAGNEGKGRRKKRTAKRLSDLTLARNILLFQEDPQYEDVARRLHRTRERVGVAVELFFRDQFGEVGECRTKVRESRVNGSKKLRDCRWMGELKGIKGGEEKGGKRTLLLARRMNPSQNRRRRARRLLYLLDRLTDTFPELRVGNELRRKVGEVDVGHNRARRVRVKLRR
jgi:hypothetical protein